MKGRYWIGMLGMLGAGTVSVLAGFSMPMCCGLIGLGATIIIGIIVGFMVTRMDDGIKADPSSAASAGALVGFFTGLGGAAGQVIAVLVFSWIISSNPDALIAQFDVGIDEHYTGHDMSAEDMLEFVKATSEGLGICYGVLSIALAVSAGALTAHLSKPDPPHVDRFTSETMPTWGMTVDESSEPPQEPPASG